MAREKTRYKAKIANNTYTIIGYESKSHMDIVSQLANEQLQDILALSPDTDMGQAAILLALNALSDQLKKQKEIVQLEQELAEVEQVAQRVQELENRLQRYEEMEMQAKQALASNGQKTDQLSPADAQKIMNQQVIEKIQQNSEKLANKK